VLVDGMLGGEQYDIEQDNDDTNQELTLFDQAATFDPLLDRRQMRCQYENEGEQFMENEFFSIQVIGKDDQCFEQEVVHEINESLDLKFKKL